MHNAYLKYKEKITKVILKAVKKKIFCNKK